MFGLLTIDEGPPLSMTAGPAVPQLLLVCYVCWQNFILVRQDLIQEYFSLSVIKIILNLIVQFGGLMLMSHTLDLALGDGNCVGTKSFL